MRFFFAHFLEKIFIILSRYILTEKKDMEHEYQRAVTRVCVQTALLLLQHGAESTVVVQMS